MANVLISQAVLLVLLCLSGLNLMEGKLNKEQWQKFPPKPYDAKANEWAKTSPNPSAKQIEKLCI